VAAINIGIPVRDFEGNRLSAGPVTLMTKRYTAEQAREQIYQYLLQKSNLVKARMIYKIQEEVHSIGKDSQNPPLTSSEPQSLSGQAIPPPVKLSENARFIVVCMLVCA
jgi:hypothetical protein